MNRLEINSLGELDILLNGDSIKDSLSRKSNILIVFLSASKCRRVSREKLASYLWNESNKKSARYNLRRALWSIKKASKDIEVITSIQDICTINETISIDFDIMELEKCYKNMDNISLVEIEDALEQYRGDFLNEIFLHNAHELNDWILYMREHYERIYFQLNEYLAKRYKELGRNREAIDKFYKLLNINPYHEDTYIQIMETYLECGEKINAINEYHKCKKLLRNELYIDTCSELDKLYDSIRSHSEYKRSLNHQNNRVNQPSVKSNAREYVCSLQSSLEYQGVQRLVEVLISSIDKSSIKSDMWREVASLVHIYPPLIHECKDAYIYPTEAAILHGIKTLIMEYLNCGKVSVRIVDLEKSDVKSKLLLKETLSKVVLTDVGLIRL